MRVQDLIEELQNMDPEAEVRIATQPSWPFEHSCANVVEVDLGVPGPEDVEAAHGVLNDPDCDDDEKEFARRVLQHDDSKPKIVYLAEGRQVGYLPGVVRSELGW